MDYAKQILDKRPIVHCITNIVTVNDCANALLAIGASPTMAHHTDEMEEMQSRCDALVCNLGATENYDAMLIAARQAAQYGHPMIIDPVGCGASTFRRMFFRKLVTTCTPICIRGNYAEITALARMHNTATGVDSYMADELEKPIEESVVALSKSTGAIVVASGVSDVISDGNNIRRVCGGDALMGRITGSGCMLSSILGAYMTVDASIESVEACCLSFKKAGEKAAFITKQKEAGTMTFKEKFIDNLYV